MAYLVLLTCMPEEKRRAQVNVTTIHTDKEVHMNLVAQA